MESVAYQADILYFVRSKIITDLRNRDTLWNMSVPKGTDIFHRVSLFLF
jgi:hypothetical protein